MSNIDPIAAATETLQTVSTVAATAAPILAVSNPQAAAVAGAIEIGAAQLNTLLASLKSGALTSSDAAATAAKISAAVQATHDAWAAFPVTPPAVGVIATGTPA